MPQAPKGKGGNFDTRTNPFLGKGAPVKHAPSCTEIPNATSVIDAIIRAGCAILLGQTRDGGALVLTILDGDNRHRTYCSTQEELDAAFNALWDMYQV